MLKERIDIHGHFFPPAYQQLLQRHHIEFLDGVKAPVWSVKRQWEYMERLHISFAVLSLSSPHLHLGDKAEAVETARGCNVYGAELSRRYPERFAALASLPLPEISESIQEIRYYREKLGICGFALLTNYHGLYLGNEELDPVMEELNRQPTLVTIHPTLPWKNTVRAAEELPGPVMEYFFETTRAVVNTIFYGDFPYSEELVPLGKVESGLEVLSSKTEDFTGTLTLMEEAA